MTPVPSDEPAAKKRTASDYKFGKVIGEGSFSTVYLAKDIHTNKEFAIKVLQKQHIVKEKKMNYVTREKNALLKLSSCNRLFVRLYATFQDVERLYFVLSYAKYSDLLAHINSSFSLECCKYYAAELLLALEILKSKNIIHRDLKPENILLDDSWHILLTDFGSSKIISDTQSLETSEAPADNQRRNSFVGTAQFVTPEVLTSGRVTYAVDLWAFGCILFQMISGTMPFTGPSDYLIFKKILALNYDFPENFDPIGKDLINKLLVLDPNDRLGFADERPYSSIREHEFFAGVNWDDLGEPPLGKERRNSNESHNAQISDELEPGFDDRKAGRLHLEMIAATPTRKKSEANRNIADVDATEKDRRLALQRGDKWNDLVKGNLILKQGLIEKRKGLFPKRRMLLLTLGPHLYYVDPDAMVLKGEIPWSADLRPEPRNFKTFHVHTPNRTYYLEDPEGYALEWCKCIDEVKAFYYSSTK
ncbi:3-phosphoinositide-dependent protein kinase 1 [Atheta coriaria]|uniref:3-phosphoinositide-dependent protein kinase 1 n=1 Tax=Dalotia coriaria TaxID=877792 RepID=UPI0031F3690B